MSLKRKASFSGAPSSPFAPASCEIDMTDNSKHLHSRTRKRFRDGRPNDEVIYEKTLRWIFSAQQQQNAAPMDTSEETMEESTSLNTPETIDPRQQSLLRFFQPRGQQAPRFKPSREALVPRANEIVMGQEDAVRRAAFDQTTTGISPSGSETLSPGFNQAEMDMDMDMDMDTDESSEGSNSNANMGVGAWM